MHEEISVARHLCGKRDFHVVSPSSGMRQYPGLYVDIASHRILHIADYIASHRHGLARLALYLQFFLIVSLYLFDNQQSPFLADTELV